MLQRIHDPAHPAAGAADEAVPDVHEAVVPRREADHLHQRDARRVRPGHRDRQGGRRPGPVLPTRPAARPDGRHALPARHLRPAHRRRRQKPDGAPRHRRPRTPCLVEARRPAPPRPRRAGHGGADRAPAAARARRVRAARRPGHAALSEPSIPT